MKVYLFYPEHGIYDDSIIYLAEGLKELGLAFFSNKTIWRTGLEPNDFLIKHDPQVSYFDCDIVVFSAYWFHYISPDNFQHKFTDLPDGFIQHRSKFRSILIDQHDGYKTITWKYHNYFDIVLRTKFNRRTFHPENYRPWVLGFTSRIIRATEGSATFDKRNKEILVNFNFTHPFEHSLRRIAREKIISKMSDRISINYSVSPNKALASPFDQLMFEQTEGKHNPDYYKLLSESAMIAAFCGDFIPGLPKDPSIYMVGGKKARIKKIIYQSLSSVSSSLPRIIQWDSWRFWEALVAGCIPIHLDLEKYGVELPVMPNNWEHYIGIDLDNINRDIERIFDDEETLKIISEKGREWAISYYSPVESAKRLLSFIVAE